MQVRIAARRRRNAAEEQIDALVHGEGTDVERQHGAGGQAEARTGFGGARGVGFDQRRRNVEDVVHGLAGRDGLGLFDERRTGADDGVGAPDREAFDALIGGHDEIADEARFIGRRIGVLFEDHLGPVPTREHRRDGTGILDAVDDLGMASAGESRGLEKERDVENGFGQGGADGEFFRADDVGRAVQRDAGNGLVGADGHDQQIDVVAEFRERLGVEADAQRRAAPLEKGLRGNQQDARLFGNHGVAFSCAWRRRRRKTASGPARRPPRATSSTPAASAALSGATIRVGSARPGRTKEAW